ncbi:MAG: tripartite tricarboxylate transporter substrate binding protein [Pusillimonas sp.]
MNTYIARILCGAIAVLFTATTHATKFPDRSVTMVVPFSPGGATDTVARIVADRMGKELGQPVIVQNKPGAGTIVGATYVENSKADGYTIFMATNTTLVTSRYLYKNLPFDPDSFEPIGMVAAGPLVLLANPARSFMTAKDVVDYATQHPGKLTFASFGQGTSSHLAGEFFKSQADIDILHVPFKGAAEANMALMQGEVDIYFDTLLTATPQIKAGKLKALGVTSLERLSSLPDVPTLVEQDFANFDVSAWVSLAAPQNTSPEILSRLEDAVTVVLKDKDVRTRILGVGFIPSDGTAQALRTQIKNDDDLTSRLVKLAKIPQQ